MDCEYRIDGANGWNLDDCTAEICEGQQLELAVNPNGLVSYVWLGPNGFSGNGNNDGNILISNSITQSMSGTYTVTATDNNGCTANKDITVMISVVPNITSITKTDETCEQSNGSITFNFINNPNRTHIEFSLDGGLTYQSQVADNIGSVTYNNLTPETYNL